MPKKTPLAVFTFNRPHHTQQMLQHLAKCRRLEECEIFIFCDGVNRLEHQTQVQQVREVVADWAKLHSAQVVIRAENFGLKKSIETGVTDLCSEFGRIIVLEDDLLVSPAFIDYQLQALDYYADDERVWQVSGFTFPFDKSGQQGAILLPLSTTWGWGTWQRAWKHYNPDPTQALEYLKTPANAHKFDLDGVYPYTRMMRKVANNHLQSWGVLFWYAVWRHEAWVVYPRQSLASNIGFDGSGVNSGKVTAINWYQGELNIDYQGDWRFTSRADMESYEKLRRYIRDYAAPKRLSQFQRVVARLKRILF